MSRSSDRASREKTRRHVVLIDAANFMYRAFFAIPGLRTSDGIPTNAVYGFAHMIHKLLRELDPDAVVAVFDAPGKGFRHELYPEYKATRDAQPEDLARQFPVVRELIEAFGIPIVEEKGFEADDLIASFVERLGDDEVTIVSTDRDLMQLVGDRVCLLDTMKDRRFGPGEVAERFGVGPDKLLDLRALVGDSSDNIPGVKGIGEKGAAKLIEEWGDLDTLLAHASEVKAKRAREALEAQGDQARLSRELATLRCDAPLGLEPEALGAPAPDAEGLRELYRRYEFTRLLDGLDGVAGTGARTGDAGADVESRVVSDRAGLAELAEAIGSAERLAVVVVGCEGGAMSAAPVGVAFVAGGETGFYVPLGHEEGTCASVEDVRDLLGRPLAEASWGGRDTKLVQAALGEQGIPLPVPAFDVEVAGFLLDPAAPRTTVALASQLLGRSLRSWEDVAGRGAKARPAGALAVDEVAAWSVSEAHAHHALQPVLAERLEREELSALCQDVELPLTRVLAQMERAGVRVDEAVLAELSKEYGDELLRIEQEIYGLAGEQFQINSPKQLQGILFEKLELPPVKKTKTGYSTDESVLEKLAAQHELPARVLAWRRLAKLKSTYVDALPPLIHPETGRIHPTFHQTGAATGRLSAANPNVQNIPIRTPEGIRIREAFVPAEGRLLLSADYSQVELRLLAHFSVDECLCQAFETGDDIHRRTASEVLGVEPEDVSGEERARAKAINFGIIYGSTAFGIANQLGIPTAEAQATIDAYFAQYPGVRRFIDDTIEQARERGYVRTLLGRRRFLPDLGSRNRVLRQAAERMAVNSVIQGTAADLIKKAMVEVDEAMADGSLEARMLLQVHDELVFEVPRPEIGTLEDLARHRMESVWSLRVPLVVDTGVGESWREAH